MAAVKENFDLARLVSDILHLCVVRGAALVLAQDLGRLENLFSVDADRDRARRHLPWSKVCRSHDKCAIRRGLLDQIEWNLVLHLQPA